MAAGYPDPLVAPEPNEATVGEPIASPLFLALAESQNFAHAEVTRVYPHQSWTGGICRYAASPALPVAEWSIAQPSPAHTQLRVIIWASASTGQGLVRFQSANTAGVLLLPIVAAGRYEGILSIGSPATGHDEVLMALEALTGDVQVEVVGFRFEPLSNPLPTGLVATVDGDTVTPMGQGAMAPGQSLPASRGVQLLGNTRAALSRPRQLICWSAVRGAGNGAPEALGAFPHRWPILTLPGTEARRLTYTLRLKLGERAVLDSTVFVRIGGERSARRLVATVPAGTAEGWHTVTLRLTEGARLVGFPDACFLSIDPTEGTGIVLAVSLWGQ